MKISTKYLQNIDADRIPKIVIIRINIFAHLLGVYETLKPSDFGKHSQGTPQDSRSASRIFNAAAFVRKLPVSALESIALFA